MKYNLKSVSDFLSDNEMKHTVGGSGVKDCGKWTDHGVGTCGFKVTFNDNSCIYGCKMTKAEAIKYSSGHFDGTWGNYCCDNCDTSTYCS